MSDRSEVVSWSGPADDEFRWTITVHDPADGSVRAHLGAALAAIRQAGAGTTRLWMVDLDESDTGDADAIAAEFGFVAYRDLWKLQAPLPPAQTTDLVTRPVQPEDYPAIIAVNSRAFSWHPEQGAMDDEDFAARRSEPWYDPNGFLVHERQGRIAGFNWTKPHRDVNPPVGEIYVIAADPDFHGQGIGRGLAIAGLNYLYDQGFGHAILYVESDNDAANRLYRDLGFTLAHINRAYRQDLVAEPSR